MLYLRVGWFGRMALKHVYYHVRNEVPVYVRYRIQDAFPILNQSIVPRNILTFVSWPAYRFLRRQVRWLYSYLCKNFPVSWDSQSQRLLHSQWSRSICFVEFPCFLYDPVNVDSLISGPLPFLNPACTFINSQFTYCWSLIWWFLSIALLACEMSAFVW